MTKEHKNLVARAIAALEDPASLTEQERAELIEDLATTFEIT